MFEKIRVAKIESKPAKNNTTLYTIIGTDGSKQSQFSDNVDLSAIVEGDAYEFGIVLDKTKQYRNITSFRLLNKEDASAIKPVNVDNEMSKSDWDQKDRRKQASIEGQSVLKELGESLRHGLWEGKEKDEFLVAYTSIIRRIIQEWEIATNSVPIKVSEDAKIPDENERLIQQGKTICHVLGTNWDVELGIFAKQSKASLAPYPSRVLLDGFIKSLRKRLPNDDDALAQAQFESAHSDIGDR